MWARAAFAALVFAAQSQGAAAYEEPFSSVKGEFWRLAQPDLPDLPDLTISISGDAIFEATPCFMSGLAFASQDGRAVYDDEFTGERTDNPACAPSLLAFDTLNKVLRTTAAARQTGTNLVLLRADGSAIATLELQRPDGIEFRRLTVSAFRYAGKLLPLHNEPDFVPDFVLYDGRIEGSSGCGGFAGGYQKLASARFKFHLSSMLAGMCPNLNRALWRVDKICRGFGGVRDVEARGEDFVLRDRHGRVQLVLSPLANGDKP